MKQSLMIWLDAARPKTLPLALVSILTGSSLAFANGQFSLSIALLAFLTATLLQILSNLANDYGDAVKGTDNENRLGPMRAMQSGAVTAQTMKQAIILNIVFTMIAGLVLIFHALTSIESILSFIALGVLAIVAAYELIKRSSVKAGSHALRNYVPCEHKKLADFKKYNEFPVTLEEEIIAKMAPLVKHAPAANAEYKPVLSDTHDASSATSDDM